MNHHPLHIDAHYAETTVLENPPSSTKDDRGVLTVETRAFNQRGERVCVFRRRVPVPTRSVGAVRPADTATESMP